MFPFNVKMFKCNQLVIGEGILLSTLKLEILSTETQENLLSHRTCI